MKKIISVLLKLVSIVLLIVFLGLGGLLYKLLSDKTGPYAETPYIIGGLVLVGALMVLLWMLSRNLTIPNGLITGGVYSIIIAGYYAFTPVTSATNVFLMGVNSGNIFTFYTDKSYALLKKSSDFHTFQATYFQHVILVLVFIAVGVILFFVAKKLTRKA